MQKQLETDSRLDDRRRLVIPREVLDKLRIEAGERVITKYTVKSGRLHIELIPAMIVPRT